MTVEVTFYFNVFRGIKYDVIYKKESNIFFSCRLIIIFDCKNTNKKEGKTHYRLLHFQVSFPFCEVFPGSSDFDFTSHWLFTSGHKFNLIPKSFFLKWFSVILGMEYFPSFLVYTLIQIYNKTRPVKTVFKIA